ncbi:MAG: helix-turn-helix transcriptional regulator [Simkania negevensis]|nr:helix-turn-helix transcriptional regulator [Simkania negevensis]
MHAKLIAQMIRFHRQKANLTQAELGNLAEVGKTTVFDVEKGKLSIRLDTLLKLLHVLNIKIEFQGPLMKLFKEKCDEKS